MHLRLPKLRGAVIEFVTVLPYMIPAIALVAGIFIIKPHARWFLNSDFSLIPFYVILALPFTYRSLDAGLKAIDLRTLVDASRSLGAGWGSTVFRVVIPNLRTAIISASFLTAAVVIGEFTIADTLLKETLPRFQATFTGREPQGGYGLNLLALIVTIALFVLLSVLTKKRDPKRKSFARMAADAALVQEAWTPVTNLTYVSVRKTFGPTVALEGLDLDVKPGELISLLGPSGCGKTTALRIAAGLRVRRFRCRARQRRRHHPHPRPQAQHGHGVPELLAVPEPHTVANNVDFGLRTPQDGRTRASPTSGRDARTGAAHPPRRPLPAPDLRRPGPASPRSPAPSPSSRRCCCSTSR